MNRFKIFNPASRAQPKSIVILSEYPKIPFLRRKSPRLMPASRYKTGGIFRRLKIIFGYGLSLGFSAMRSIASASAPESGMRPKGEIA
jgi:hypothetical protein